MKKVVTIGGGTGQFMILNELKNRTGLEISALVVMGDNGGSTGELRDSMGVLPPGDIRQALVALSPQTNKLRDLFAYRFSHGRVSGHSFGNLFLSALEDLSGSFTEAIDSAREILSVSHKVLPATLEPLDLLISYRDGSRAVGEKHLDLKHTEERIESVSLLNPVAINPQAAKVLNEADLIVICPGTFYASIIPHTLVGGFADAIRSRSAPCILLSNIVGPEHTTASDYATKFEHYAEVSCIDHILCIDPTQLTDHQNLLNTYEQDKEYLVLPGNDHRVSIKPLLELDSSTSLLRHNSRKTVDTLLTYL